MVFAIFAYLLVGGIVGGACRRQAPICRRCLSADNTPENACVEGKNSDKRVLSTRKHLIVEKY